MSQFTLIAYIYLYQTWNVLSFRDLFCVLIMPLHAFIVYCIKFNVRKWQ